MEYINLSKLLLYYVQANNLFENQIRSRCEENNITCIGNLYSSVISSKYLGGKTGLESTPFLQLPKLW